ncbi:MAG TPA: PfkB family carbohydrate kinase [Anaerolineales bacterium]|nr:PfkB family carbohydrate kinase [Anaerolineales bacterium]
MARIIGVGDNTVDTYTHLRIKFPGGNAVNVPVLAQRYGAQGAYLGCVGKDAEGTMILNSLIKEGIDISHCRQLDELPTAFSTVNVVDGDRVFGKSDPGASQSIHLSDEDLEYIAGFDLVHTSVFSFIEGQLPELKAHSRMLSFDLSQRCDEEYLKAVLPYTDIAFLSLSGISDAERDQLMRKMISLGPKLVVMTRGKDGSWVYDGKQLYHQGILPVETVDSLGAGDAFAARFLVEILHQTVIPKAMELAALSAAENCTQYGAYGYGQNY